VGRLWWPPAGKGRVPTEGGGWGDWRTKRLGGEVSALGIEKRYAHTVDRSKLSFLKAGSH